MKHGITQAAILVGGLGTRLRSVLSDLPKPLAPIKGKPFLFFLLEKLRENHILDIVLLTGYMHEKVEETCGDGSKLGLKITYSRESKLLGTAGALKLAEAKLKHDQFLLLNGDSYFPEAITRLAKESVTPGNLGKIAVSPVPDTTRYGSVDFSLETGIISGFREKELRQAPGFVNGGVYCLSRELLSRIPENNPSSLEQDIFPAAIKAQPGSLSACVVEHGFDDIGTPESYDTFIRHRE